MPKITAWLTPIHVRSLSSKTRVFSVKALFSCSEIAHTSYPSPDFSCLIFLNKKFPQSQINLSLQKSGTAAFFMGMTKLSEFVVHSGRHWWKRMWWWHLYFCLEVSMVYPSLTISKKQKAECMSTLKVPSTSHLTSETNASKILHALHKTSTAKTHSAGSVCVAFLALMKVLLIFRDPSHHHF